MAEQSSAPNVGAPGDNYSNWLEIAKQRIKVCLRITCSLGNDLHYNIIIKIYYNISKTKEREKSITIKKIHAMQQLALKSINDTLVELKLGKYEGALKYFTITENDVINKVLNEWSNSKLNDWKGPILNENDNEIKWEKYEEESYKFADLNKCFVNHAFWELMLNELWKYSKSIANEKFPNSSDIQLCDTLNKCLSVCCLLDILKGSISFNDTFKNEARKKQNLLLKETMTSNVNLQSLINDNVGTKLDIEKWKRSEDADKMYRHCGLTIQKEAMKSGKAFVKLYKIYKLTKHKEKKRRKEEAERKAKEKQEAEQEEKEVAEKQQKEEEKLTQEQQKKEEITKEEPEPKKEEIPNPTDDLDKDNKNNAEEDGIETAKSGNETKEEDNDLSEVNNSKEEQQEKEDNMEKTKSSSDKTKEDDIKEVSDEKVGVDNSKKVKVNDGMDDVTDTGVENSKDIKSEKGATWPPSNYSMFGIAIAVALIVIILGYLLK